jgi:hypothetical protein
VGQRPEIASTLRLCVVLSFVNAPAIITCSGGIGEEAVGGKLDLLVVLVVGLVRLAAGASSSSVSQSESVIIGLRPSCLMGPSSLGVLELHLHLLFLVDVVSSAIDPLLCVQSSLDWRVAFAIKSAVYALRSLPSSYASSPCAVLVEARASFCVIALWRATHFSFFLMPLVIQYCRL